MSDTVKELPKADIHDLTYRKGYNVLPGLRKLSEAEHPVFYKDEHYDYYRLEKRRAANSIDQHYQHYRVGLLNTWQDDVSNYISDNASWVKYGRLDDKVMQLQEDIVVHRVEELVDFMEYGHVCFPSGWLPEEQVGKSFREIHEGVPGFNFEAIPNILKGIMKTPYERYLWMPSYETERRINFHPSRTRKDFDPDNPHIHIKYERQCTIPFPEHNMFLFTIRQGWIDRADIDWVALHKAIVGMSPEHKEHREITPEIEYYLLDMAELSPFLRKPLKG